MSNLPLENTCVLDLTHSWAGPHCTRILADFGADVIIVEYPSRLSMFRGGKTNDQAYNRQPSWHQVNRNKYGITLDLEEKEDREIFRDLVRQTDVIVENSRSGVMQRLGFGYEDLRKIKADLIMASLTAYGATGPLAACPAYGAALEVMSGIQNLTAYGEGEKPHRIREMDVINGVGGAAAVLTALVYRQRTGDGQYIDFSQAELPLHALMGEHLLEHVMNGSHAAPTGNRHRRFAPQGCYPCRGEDRWVTLTVQSEAQWERFCHALSRPAWIRDPRFATNADRMRHHEELDGLIEEWSSQQSHYESMQVLQSYRVPAAAVLDSADLATDPHLREREYFATNVVGNGEARMGLPFRLSRADATVRWQGPDLGQHNERIICGRLGRPPESVKTIREETLGTAFDPE